MVRIGLPIAAGLLALVAVLAWVLNFRAAGAALIGLSLAAALAPALAAPGVAADRLARQMRTPGQDPRRLSDLPPHEVSTGLLLVVLWRLRWMILAGLAFAPALAIGILRLDVSDFATWRELAEVLGGATAAGRTVWLLPGGGIPYGRLALRALSAALVPWAALPAFAALGVTSALLLEDPALGALAALLAEVITAPLLLLAWNALTRTPLLAAPYELIRALLLAALIGGLVYAAVALTRVNARLLGAA